MLLIVYTVFPACNSQWIYLHMGVVKGRAWTLKLATGMTGWRDAERGVLYNSPIIPRIDGEE